VGEEFRIEYISPLAQAQKMSGLTSIEQGIGFIGQAAQFDQTVLDKVNLTEAVANYLAQVGVPAAMIRSDEEVDKSKNNDKKPKPQPKPRPNSKQLSHKLRTLQRPLKTQQKRQMTAIPLCKNG